MLTEIESTQYVVKVNGIPVSSPQPTLRLAEAILLALPAQQQVLAEIIPVTSGGQQILLG